MRPPVRIGVLGCGQIAQRVHLPILSRLSGVQIAALAETDSRHLHAAARYAPRAMRLADFRRLLAAPEVDAVIICLPNDLHASAAIEAMQAGKHVYLEKPLATNLVDGERLMAVWQETGVVGMIGLNYRFNALVQRLRSQIQSGILGELVAVRSVFSTPARSIPRWKERRETGGGVLLDLASHHVDLVHSLFDSPIVEVFAQTRSLRSQGDTATLELRLADGLLVQSLFSLAAVDEDRFEVFGTKGKLSFDRYRSFNVQFSRPGVPGRLKAWAGQVRATATSPGLLSRWLSPVHEPSFAKSLEHFVAAIRTGSPARPDFSDGWRALEVIDAAERSAAVGHAIEVARVPLLQNLKQAKSRPATPLVGVVPALLHYDEK